MSVIEELANRADKIFARCATSGKCYNVCPVAEESQFDVAAGVHVVERLKRLAGNQDYAQAAENWAQACDGSGHCLDACPERLDVLDWVAIRQTQRISRPIRRVRKEATSQQFKTMAKAAKLLAMMQLSPFGEKDPYPPAW